MKILEAETKKIKEAAVSVEEHTGITALVFGGNSSAHGQPYG